MHIVNWKKLLRNTVETHKQCVWKQCTHLSYHTIIDTDQLEELFSRKQTSKKESHKDSHIVRILLLHTILIYNDPVR